MTPSKPVPSLSAQVLAPDRVAALDAEFTQVIEARIRKSPGLKGIALRTGVGVLAAAKPDIVKRGVARLLPDFISALDPLYENYHRSGGASAQSAAGSFGDYLLAHRKEAVAAMMQTADRRTEGSTNPMYHRFYGSLRGTIEREADAILPEMARNLDEELSHIQTIA
ncbi:MAG TPA: hypothetical protein VFQ88_01855 [Nevskiaceae bacterium]|nr:hypothetical protein [Nevskiaceae bacterium]